MFITSIVCVPSDETRVGDLGWMAWASDPDGNVFALWKNNPDMPCS